MADVKWIKITTSMFDDEKIKLIESMPDKDSILVIWVKLLVQAGRTNVNGYIFLNEKIPYTDEMLATIFNRPLNTVRLALQTFERFGMIEMDENGIHIKNWDKHQNINGLEKIREQTRARVQKHRELKQIESGNVTVTLRNATDIEEDIDKDKEREKEKHPATPYEKIKTLYTDNCKRLPTIRTLSEQRKKHIQARWKQYEYSIAIFEELFKKAGDSDFLAGHNDRNWKADFEWLMNDNNMAKVLEGKYDNKEEPEQEYLAPYHQKRRRDE